MGKPLENEGSNGEPMGSSIHRGFSIAMFDYQRETNQP